MSTIFTSLGREYLTLRIPLMRFSKVAGFLLVATEVQQRLTSLQSLGKGLHLGVCW